MKVAALLDSRRNDWRELENLCIQFEGRSRRQMPAEAVSQLSRLYRAACADLALADAYQLPPGTVRFLHHLVGRAHNQLYRGRSFDFAGWSRELLVETPRRLYRDNCLRAAFFLFWGVFLLAAIGAYNSPEFAEKVISKDQMEHMESMYADAPMGRRFTMDSAMFGFYASNNPTIGLMCFIFGLIFGIGGLYLTLYNALLLGAVFGHMARTPQADNFFTFVTAHGPFELTAIVLCAAAGMRLGFALIHTEGYSRTAALRRAGRTAVPIVSLGVLLFFAAALIEAFISPSSLPYAVKAGVAVVSTALLVFYFIGLGYPRRAA